jgi:hypothetical protein
MSTKTTATWSSSGSKRPLYQRSSHPMPNTDLKLEYKQHLCGHVRYMAHRLRKLPADKWDWAPDVAAPTARILATHTWQWLICDRQHINEPDPTKHPLIPDAPIDPTAMCDAIDTEIGEWEKMIDGLTPEQLVQPRTQFGQGDINVLWFLGHMLQNCIYKHGQFSTLFFALGLDGTEPYDAPFPNTYYRMLHEDNA